MMKSEFCELTGTNYYDLRDRDYQRIEMAYYEYPGDKRAFCEAWNSWNASTREFILTLAESSYNLERYAEELQDTKKRLINKLGKAREIVRASGKEK